MQKQCAGGPSILDECKNIRAVHGHCPSGKAVITGGGRLRAKWVIHAVGPVWSGGDSNEAELLASAYRCSPELAAEVGARSVSFPSISTDAYGYPVGRAATIAVKELKSCIATNSDCFDELCFVLFDSATYDAYKTAACAEF